MNNKKLIFAIGLLIVIVFALFRYFMFVSDVGLNSRYFVKRDFNNAFFARVTGNCDEFREYFIQSYAEEWVNRCLEEKRRKDAVPIDQYEIKNISFANNKAFLQVELTRTNSSRGTYTYTVNYEMERRMKWQYLKIFHGTRYLINQGIAK